MNYFERSQVITEPSQEDCNKLVDLLSRGYYARAADTHEPLPALSNFHLNGVVAVVFSEESAASSFARDAAAAYEIDTEVARVTGLWDFFQECAFCGYEGVVLDNYYPVTFFNRLTDMDRSLPTLMWMRFPDSMNDLHGFFFSRMGVVKTEPGTTVKWLDYEKLDKASNRYVLFGNPLPEPIEAYAITGESQGHVMKGGLQEPAVDLIFQNGASFLGPYVSDIGAVPIFSQKQWALYFAGQNGLLQANQGNDEESLADGYEIVRVDLFEILDRVYRQHGPFVDIGLNPLCHRFRQGWFFKHQNAWMLETISGVWEISSAQVTLRTDVGSYKGHLGSVVPSSLIEAGVTSMIGTPFKRLTGANRTPLTEEDATELLESQFAKSFEPQVIEDNASIPVDAFVIDAFDKVSGERFALSNYDDTCNDLGFLVFPDVIAAVAYLIHDVLPHDEHVRLNGYRLCHGGGAAGSQDSAREARVTSGIVAALRKTLLDAMTKGYRPEHGLHVKRLMQDATVTFEINEIGYYGDLVFYGTSDGGAVEDRVDSGDPEDREAVKEAERKIKQVRAVRRKIIDGVNLSPTISAQLRKALGQSYDMLTVESRVIAATVVEEFNRTGMRPGYDYAGISMKASKLIERELTIRVFRPWRDAVRKQLGKDRLAALQRDLEASPADRTEQVLAQWLQKKSKLDLGAMRFALTEAREASSSTPFRKLLADYLATLPGGFLLTSSEFETILYDISTKYRNGGVHEHVVTYDICREAVDRILLGPQPLLRRLMEATAGANVK
jgi:hypothetical protein